MKNNFAEPWEEAERREAEADRGAIKCDCCGGSIRVGELKYRLDMDSLDLIICDDCKCNLVSSAEIHGCEE